MLLPSTIIYIYRWSHIRAPLSLFGWWKNSIVAFDQYCILRATYMEDVINLPK